MNHTPVSRTDHGDRREWALGHYEVNFIHLDYRFGFDLYGFKGSDGYLRTTINVPFILRTGDRERTYDPERTDEIAGALQILHKAAKSVVVHRNGTLEVMFEGDILLRAEKHPQYESWKATGEGELSDIAFMCTPHEGPPWRK
jgi:uncharacterized protein DUF6188